MDRDRCKGCGLCVEFCPFGHLHLDEELNLAGYHPVEPEAPDDAAAGLHADGARPGEDRRAGAREEGYEHNFAYWCLRCRYCEIICPDAAVRLAGDVGGSEGTAGWEDDDSGWENAAAAREDDRDA